MPIDLDAYLSGIGYRGPITPTLATLQSVCQLHPQSLTFNSVYPWLGLPVHLDLPTLEAKLVNRREGGYCFEQNTLLWAALAQIGFDVRGLSARVVYSTPPGGGRHPRNHMLMLVDLDGEKYVADAGFGGLTLTAPLRLSDEAPQQTPHETVRIGRTETVADLRDYVLEAEAGGQWRAMYQFGLEEQIDADYEMANWFTGTFPGSAFVQRLIAARPVDAGRLALSDNRLSVHRIGLPSIQRTIESASELSHILENDFAITLPDHPDLAARLQAIVTPTEA